MVNAVISAVSIAIDGEFGGAYPVTANKDMEQGLKEPCFFIAAIEPATTRKLGESYFGVVPLDVRYYPADPRNNAEMHAAASRLFDCLEVVTTTDGVGVRGDNISHRVVDGVLHFFVTYKTFAVRRSDREKMGMVQVTPEIVER